MFFVSRFIGPYYRTILVIVVILQSQNICCFAQEEAKAYFDFGIFAFEEGDYEGAAKNFQQAIRFDPKQAEYHHYLGKTYLQSGQLPKAEKALNQAYQLYPALDGLTFDMALVQYRLGVYPIATYLFAEELAANPSNALAQYYMAVCMYRRNQYKQALTHFIGSADKSPSIQPNGYFYAGICHMQLNETQKALKKFSWVAANARDKELKANAHKWLSSAQAIAKATDPLKLSFRVGTQYDNNVVLEPEDQDLYADEGDFNFSALLSGRYRLFQTKYHLSGGIGYSHYQSLYLDLNDFNLMGAIPQAFATLTRTDWMLGLTLQPIYYWLADERYLLRKQAGLDLYWNISDRFANQYRLIYYDESNYRNSGRSGQNIQLSVDGLYQMQDEKGSWQGGFSLEQNQSDHPDYDYYGMSITAGLSREVPGNITLSPSVSVYGKQYRNTDSNYHTKRDDLKLELAARLSRNLGYPWLTGSLEYKYTGNDSSIDLYTYKSHKIGFFLTAGF